LPRCNKRKNMSRIGKLPVFIPEGVSLVTEGKILKVKGPKGELEREIPKEVKLKIETDKAMVLPVGVRALVKPYLGTTRSHVANMVQGVSSGWSKTLELVGVGFRAEVIGKNLSLTLGFSHPVLIEAPAGINFKVEKSLITVEGANKEEVGRIADEIRRVKPPEPYKGKGIRYTTEKIRRKPGKAAAKTQGPAA